MDGQRKITMNYHYIDWRLAVQIPGDFILMLSGVPCVGKTTTAYNILKYQPEFRLVSELDIIRTIVRATIRNIENCQYVNKEMLQDQYAALFYSLSESNLSDCKKQSTLLVPYVREIVARQQRRNIPTIIEGLSIIPSTYFSNDKPIKGFEKNVFFINLFLSDEQEHIQRRYNRCKEREYQDTEDQIKEQVINIRNSKNCELHEETLELSKATKNVASFDVSNMDQDSVVKKILSILGNYINC